ncbi:bcl-2-like protein 2 isoform X2 [Acanthaster planci]|nr:bcl-2-like protein 2 isoform X2 [Acanthaster planci]
MPDLTTASVVTDYIHYKLSSKGLGCPLLECSNVNISIPATPFQEVIREVTRNIEHQYQQDLNGMAIADILHVTPDTLSGIFHGVVHEIFHGAPNGQQNASSSVQPSWGRICSLLAFSGALAVRCVENEMPQLVGQVVHLTTSYVNANLLTWIDQNGGWKCLFQPPDDLPQGPWMHDWMMFGAGMVALGAVTALALRLLVR